MALTFDINTTVDLGGRTLWVGTVAFDDSYSILGEAVVASDFGFDAGQLDSVMVGTGTIATKRVLWDPSTSKLIIMIEDGTSGKEAEAADESDQAAVIDVILWAIGR